MASQQSETITKRTAKMNMKDDVLWKFKINLNRKLRNSENIKTSIQINSFALRKKVHKLTQMQRIKKTLCKG